jgi:DNA-binding response OmpR family regulator
MSEKIKILLVDDDPMSLKFLEEVFRERYVYKLAQNGQVALEIAQSFRPDIVVLDIMMPGNDGFGVCRSLRNNDPTGEIKIVFASAKQLNIEQRIDLNKCGYGYLLKPFGPAELEYQIRGLLAV